MPGIGQITHDSQQNAFWAGNALYIDATASQASGAASVIIADLLAGAQANDTQAIIDAKALTIVVYNNSTAQTITGLSLNCSGSTATGGTGSISYAITSDVTGSSISIASGSTQTFLVPLIKGVLRTFTLMPTFGAAPAAGSVDIITTVHGSGAAQTAVTGTPSVQLTGSSATLPVGGTGGEFYSGNVGSGLGDASPLSATGMINAGLPFAFNGTNYDRNYNNTQGTLLASAARTSTTISPDATNFNAEGGFVSLLISAIPAVPSSGSGLQLTVRGRDASGNYFNLTTQTGLLNAVGLYVLAIFPSASGTTDQIIQSTSQRIPRVYDVVVSAPTSDSYTYSLAYSLIN